MPQMDARALLRLLTPTCIRAVERAVVACVSARHPEVGIAHLWVGIATTPGADPTVVLGAEEIARAARVARANLDALGIGTWAGKPEFAPALLRCIEDAWRELAEPHGDTRVRSGALIAALVRDPGRYGEVGAVSALLEVAPGLGSFDRDALASSGEEAEARQPRAPVAGGPIVRAEAPAPVAAASPLLALRAMLPDLAETVEMLPKDLDQALVAKTAALFLPEPDAERLADFEWLDDAWENLGKDRMDPCLFLLGKGAGGVLGVWLAPWLEAPAAAPPIVYAPRERPSKLHWIAASLDHFDDMLSASARAKGKYKRENLRAATGECSESIARALAATSGDGPAPTEERALVCAYLSGATFEPTMLLGRYAGGSHPVAFNSLRWQMKRQRP